MIVYQMDARAVPLQEQVEMNEHWKNCLVQQQVNFGNWISKQSLQPQILYLCLYVVTSFHQIQNLLRFLLQGHESLGKFMQVHAIIMLAYYCYFFYSLSREFSTNPRCSSTSLPSLGLEYSSFSFGPVRAFVRRWHPLAKDRSQQAECLWTRF